MPGSYIKTKRGDITEIQNVAGPQGVQGEIGITGPQGIQGKMGVMGTTGIQGTSGIIGLQGPQGDIGLTGATGAKGLIWKGPWSNVAAYIVDDAVYYNKSSYICVLANTNQQPTNSTYWNILVK